MKKFDAAIYDGRVKDLVKKTFDLNEKNLVKVISKINKDGKNSLIRIGNDIFATNVRYGVKMWTKFVGFDTIASISYNSSPKSVAEFIMLNV